MKRIYESEYRQQKRIARSRGIEFNLTFGQWIRIWLKSGHLAHRGRKRGQYVMARRGDTGPYDGSVEIILSGENLSYAHKGKNLSNQHREKISLAINKPDILEKIGAIWRGKNLSEKHKNAIKIGMGRAQDAGKHVGRPPGITGKRLSNEHKKAIKDSIARKRASGEQWGRRPGWRK